MRLRYALHRQVRRRRQGRGAATSSRCTAPTIRHTRSGTPGAESRKVKGNIHWLSAAHAERAEVRLYDRLFVVPEPGRAREVAAIRCRAQRYRVRRRSTTTSNSTSRPSAIISTISIRRASASSRRTSNRRWREAAPESRYQFERHGYFVADSRESRPARPMFNRAVTLRDSWGKDAPAKAPELRDAYGCAA